MSRQLAELHARWARKLTDGWEDAVRQGGAHIPTPMIVVGPRPDQQEVVADGVCGHAIINLIAERDGESRSFVNWLSGTTPSETPPPPGTLARRNIGRTGYRISISPHGQSLERASVTANVFANYLRQAAPELHVRTVAQPD